MEIVHTLLILMLAVGITAAIARVTPVPLPLLQVTVGALLEWSPMIDLHVRLDPELFFQLFIPPLLFADGWRIPKRAFWQLLRPILLLAVGLVLLTVLIAGYFIHWLLPMIPLPAAFALAAVLSPTDAVAVSAMTGRGQMPGSVRHILDGEAMMNDASGLVAFKFGVAAAVTGVFSIGNAALSFMLIAIGGLAVGAFLSWTFGWVRRLLIKHGLTDAAVDVLLAFLLPFAAYAVAEKLGVSGILAAVAAGVMQSYSDALPTQVSSRLLGDGVGSMLEFIFNGLVFLLLGIELPVVIDDALGGTLDHASVFLIGVVGVIYLGLMLMRMAWISANWALSHLAHATVGGERPRLRTTMLLTFGGVRGAITLAGALSLPRMLRAGVPFPGRSQIIFIAAGVIILSLMSGAVGLPLLLRNVEQESDEATTLRRARLKLAAAALRAIHDAEAAHQADANVEMLAVRAEVVGRLVARYRLRIERLEGRKAEDSRALSVASDDIEYSSRLLGLRAERRELYALRQRGEVDDTELRLLLREIDLNETALISVWDSAA